MLTKTQTVGRIPLEGVHQRMNTAMRACVSWAAIEEHDKILDMACGEGEMLAYLNDQLKLTLCGMCKSAEQARAISEMLGEADVIPALMEDIPWRNNTFDVVMLPARMRGDPKRILDEVIRVLRPGGQFVMASRVMAFRGDNDMNRREIMRMMQEAGFREVSFRATWLCGAIVGWKPGQIDHVQEHQK
ncbi:MAG: methyltransferase domain-containing protein [Clostridia bacterium]|nr:methyltransferase domain-containing protein [Clostridia bacterium]